MIFAALKATYQSRKLNNFTIGYIVYVYSIFDIMEGYIGNGTLTQLTKVLKYVKFLNSISQYL